MGNNNILPGAEAAFRKALAECLTEEEVKAAFIKRFRIKVNTRANIDLYTEQMLYEFKLRRNLSNRHELARTLAQALYYVRRLKYNVDTADVGANAGGDKANNYSPLQAGAQPIPQHICLADAEAAVITPTAAWHRYICNDGYDWDMTPSSPDPALVADLEGDDELKKTHVYGLRDPEGTRLFCELAEKIHAETLPIEGLERDAGGYTPASADNAPYRGLECDGLSAEARAVLDAGREVYRFYFARLEELRVAKFGIATWDAGWWQIRMALGDAGLGNDLLAAVKEAHNALRAKLLPKLSEYGII